MVKCLATDSETGGIGCDNMTIVIVALLGGRTPEQWQAWVKERVEKKCTFAFEARPSTGADIYILDGYDTPENVPDIFGQAPATTGSRMGGLTGAGFRSGAGGLANIASILGASGITLRQADDSDDEDEDDEKDELDSAAGAKATYLDDKAVKKGTKPVDITDDLVRGALYL
jgi:protein phosphatase 2C family protein 2/3